MTIQAQDNLQDKDKDLQDANNGANDGKEADKEHEPPVDSPRWKDIYWKTKEQDRIIQELNAQMVTMGEHTKKLTETIENDRKTKAQAGFNDDINKLEADIEQAAMEGDTVKVVRLQNKLNRAYLQSNSKNIDEDELVKKTAQAVTGIVKTQSDTVVYTDWVTKNKWFDEDPFMRGAAIELDRQLAIQGVPVHERLKKIDEEIPKRFNAKNSSSQFSDVEGNGGKKPSNNNQAGNLTDEEKRVAKACGLTYAEYAKQKQIIAGGANV